MIVFIFTVLALAVMADGYRLVNQSSSSVRNDVLSLMCEQNGVNNSALEIAGADYLKCVEVNFGMETFEREFTEAQYNDSYNELFKKYCAKIPQLKVCYQSLMDAVSPCLGNASEHLIQTTKNAMNKILDYLCEDDGAIMSRFSTEGGPQCLRSKSKEIIACAVNFQTNTTYKNTNMTALEAEQKLTELEKCINDAATAGGKDKKCYKAEDFETQRRLFKDYISKKHGNKTVNENVGYAETVKAALSDEHIIKNQDCINITALSNCRNQYEPSEELSLKKVFSKNHNITPKRSSCSDARKINACVLKNALNKCDNEMVTFFKEKMNNDEKKCSIVENNSRIYHNSLSCVLQNLEICNNSISTKVFKKIVDIIHHSVSELAREPSENVTTEQVLDQLNGTRNVAARSDGDDELKRQCGKDGGNCTAAETKKKLPEKKTRSLVKASGTVVLDFNVDIFV